MTSPILLGSHSGTYEVRRTVNVGEFGTLGTADDAAVWQAALDEALEGPIHLTAPAGDYTLRNLVIYGGTIVDLTGVTLTYGGANPLPGGEEQNGILRVIGAVDDVQDDIQIINGTLVGARTAGSWAIQGDDIIQITHARNILIRSVRVTDAGQDGIEIKDTDTITVDGCYFQDIGDAAVEVRNGVKSTIKNCRFLRVRNAIQSKPATDDVTVQDCLGETFGDGIQFHGDRWRIIGNTFSPVTTDDGEIGANHAGITIFENPGATGGPFSAATGNIIDGNVVSGYAIGIEGGANGAPHGPNTVRGNVISGCASGILMRGPTRVAGNSVVTAVTRGILVRLATGAFTEVSDNYLEACEVPIQILGGDGSGHTITNNTIVAGTAATSGTGLIHLPASFESASHDPSKSVIEGNSVSGTDVAIRADAVADLTISGNRISTNNQCVLVGASATITGNIIVSTSTGTEAVRLNGAGAVVSGNRITGGSQGVRVNAANCVVSGNRISGAAFWGVNVLNTSTDSLVVGNNLTGNTSGGLTDAGTTTLVADNRP